MSKTYFKSCDYCKEKIEMSYEEGKWLHDNMNNGPHDCRKKEQNHKEIALEMVQRKLESIGIIINVERLMAQ